MKKHNGFSLIEVLMLFAALSVILAVSTPLLTKQHKNVPQKIPHGFYQCYRDENNNLHEELYNTFRRIDKNGNNPVEKCSFDPPAEATMFKITLIGGGTGGYSHAEVDTKFNLYKSTYELDTGYTKMHLYRTLDHLELSRALNGLNATFCSGKSADGGSGSGVRQEYKAPGGLKCTGTSPDTEMTVTGWNVTAKVEVTDRDGVILESGVVSRPVSEVEKNAAERTLYDKLYEELAQRYDVYTTSDSINIDILEDETAPIYDPEQVKRKEAKDEIAALEASYSGDTSLDTVMSEISKIYRELCIKAGYDGAEYDYYNETSITGYGGSGGNGRYYQMDYPIRKINQGEGEAYLAYLKKIPGAGTSGFCSDSGCGDFKTSGIISNGKNGDYYQLILRGIIKSFTESPTTAVTTDENINKNCTKKPTNGTNGTGYGALRWTDPDTDKTDTFTVKPGTGGTLGDVTLVSAGNNEYGTWYKWEAKNGTDGDSDLCLNCKDSCATVIPKCVIDTNRIIKNYVLGRAGTQGSLETFTKFGLGKVPCKIQVGIGGNPKKYDSTRQAYKESDLLDIDTVLSCSGTYIKVNGGRDDINDQKYEIQEYIPAYLPSNGKAYIQGLGPDMGLYSGYNENDNTKDTHDYNKGLLGKAWEKAKGKFPKFTYPTLWLRYIAKKDIPFGKAGDGTQLWDKCVWPQGIMTYYGSYNGTDRASKNNEGSVDIWQDAGVGKCDTSDYTGGDSAYSTWKDTPVSGSKGIGGGVFIRW